VPQRPAEREPFGTAVPRARRSKSGGPGSKLVTGVLTPASVIGPVAQNITAGDFNGVVSALESETAYGNIHTAQFPAGEIRGQLRERGR
jgi:hypothetical protein